MKGFTTEIETAARENDFFRKVLYTAPNCQLVVMSLKPNEDIGAEVHLLDQFICCEQGAGAAVIDSVTHNMTPGVAIIVPAGAHHNITNTSDTEVMKLYTVYAPPNHRDGIIHKTKADAEADTEHFDGHTTELT
jgi:mannose-6-phosphate isomerase-like protein (cupin superfamily)